MPVIRDVAQAQPNWGKLTSITVAALAIVPTLLWGFLAFWLGGLRDCRPNGNLHCPDEQAPWSTGAWQWPAQAALTVLGASLVAFALLCALRGQTRRAWLSLGGAALALAAWLVIVF